MINQKQVDMTEGSIFKKLFIFSIPLILINILNQFFHAADVAVVGIFSDDQSVAAVSSTGALTNLITGLFTGMSVGANVLIAKFIGAKNFDSAKKTVGTAILTSIVSGLILTIIFQLFTYNFLEWMGSDPDVIDDATTYLKTYALGMPIIMLYNFGAAILRALGDSVRPMIYVLIGGVANVVLNVVFVAGFGIVEEGVAIATVMSNLICAILMLIALFKNDYHFKLKAKDLRFNKREFIEMFKIGLPSGIQGMCFAISNVIVQSNINSFGDQMMAANGASGQIDAFIYNIGNGIYLGTLPFVSQNYGAGKYDRLRKIPIIAVLINLMIAVPISILVLIFGRQLLSIFTTTPEVVNLALIRLNIIVPLYFMCGIMEICSAAVRGVGKSTSAMVISIFGSCIVRILYLTLIFPLFTVNREIMLYLVWPMSWIITVGIYIAVIISSYKNLKELNTFKEKMEESVS